MSEICYLKMIIVIGKSNMESLSKPAIVRLARRAGVKSVSEECYPKVRNHIDNMLDEITSAIMIVHKQNKTKIVMTSELYKALETLGYNVAQSDDVNTSMK